MKAWKKALAILMALGLLAGTLAACGNSEGTAGEEAPAATEGTDDGGDATASEAGDGDATIELFTRFADGASKTFFEEAAADFMAANPGVNITVSSADNESYKQEINVRLASNEAPDIYFAWSGVYAQNFADGGRALDLSGYMDRFAGVIQNQFGPFTFGGNVYGVPLIMDGKTFYYNMEIFEEMELSVPENWDDFMDVLDALSGSDYIPISLGNIDDWATGHYMTTLNQRVVPADTLAADYALEGDFSDATYVKALEYLMELTPYFTAEFNSVTYDEGINDFTSGKAAIYYEQFNQVQYIEPAEFEWSWFDFPDIDGAAGDQNALTGAPQGLMVSADTAYPEVCVDFLAYLTTVEVASKMVADTMMISTVDGAINSDSANDKLIQIAETIKGASSINLWLDNATDSEVVAVYLQGIQAMVGGSMTPEEVMEEVQAKAAEVS